MRKAIEEAKKFVCTTKDRIVKDAKEFIQNVDWKKVASGAFMWGAIGGAVGGGTTEVFKDVGSNVLGKVGKKLVEDGADMALDLTQTATENGGLTGKDFLFSAVTSFGGDLVGAAKTNSTARNQLIDGATDNRAIKDAVGDSLTDNKAVKNAIADSATDNKAVKNAVKDSTSEATNVGLKNGSKLKTNDALDAAEDFLGKGYKDAGNGRFISADGTKVVRMGDNDILGKHGGGPHMNFETMAPNPAKPGKMQVIDNMHIYLED